MNAYQMWGNVENIRVPVSYRCPTANRLLKSAFYTSILGLIGFSDVLNAFITLFYPK